MSTYTVALSCDWPGCGAIGEVSQPGQGPERLPAGWVRMPPPVSPHARWITDFCSIHARARVADLVAVLESA